MLQVTARIPPLLLLLLPLSLSLAALTACGEPVSGSYHATGSGADDAGAPPFPATCSEIASASPGAADGEQTLYLEHDPARPWAAYCHDLAGAPVEYLSLIQTGPSQNFSQYTAGGASKGTSVTTAYAKIRVDPETLLVNIADQRFSSSTGALEHETIDVISMPYGVAADCAGKATPLGKSNIDLRGTPFAVTPDAFILGGFNASDSTTYESRNQVVDLRGGGYCGWIAPLPGVYNPVNQNGDFQLSLAYLDPE